MKAFRDVQFNVDMAKKKGYDYFKANIKDLVDRGMIGEKVEGKIITPSDQDIRNRYQQITGKTVEVKPEKNDK
jgi:hypothetical protein